ncbi:MAG TPA: DUF2911 domain-containing protein [Longimicrobiales bacterium]
MTGRWWTLGLALAAAACGAQSQDAVEEGRSAAEGAAAEVALACAPQAPWEELAERASPYDSASVDAAGLRAKVCYSRPYMKGRTIFGAEGEALVPYGKLWRTGANEPTTIHLATAAQIAGIAVEPGSYSIYTIPGENEWTVIVNRSTSQWGHESRYTPEVEAQEVGRATVPAESTAEAVEQFTISWEPAEGGSSLVLEWANTRVAVPVTTATT